MKIFYTMNAEIITIGDEILLGQIVDTNSAWLSAELAKIGINVVRKTSVGDTRNDILNALKSVQLNVELVVITGGLGPTADDITKPALAEFFDTRLVIDDKVLRHIKQLIQEKGFPLNDRNIKQAEVPENCKILCNESGTAPGMWFEKQGKVFISLPGVPFEMKKIFSDYAIPEIKKFFKLPVIVYRTVMTKGIMESELADRLSDFEKQLPSEVSLAYLPSPEAIRLRITAKGSGEKELLQVVDNQIKKLNTIIPDVIFGYDDEYLEFVIGRLLKEQKKTVATAESCTGGFIAHKITSVAGSSAYFKGAVVAYDNSVKTSVLNVSVDDLEKYGAVSQPVVEQMAKGVRNLLNTDFAIATSGIAGPTGGTDDKPVGTVWIAVAAENKTVSKLFHFSRLRDINIRRSSAQALNMLRLLIIDKI